MKFAKLIAILLMVLLSAFFLISSEKGVEKSGDKNKFKVRVKCGVDKYRDFDFTRDLARCLEGLDKKIERIVEASLKDLEVSIDMEGLEERLKSLDSLKDINFKVKHIAESECLKILEDLEFFFEDFDWNFDFHWDCSKKIKHKEKQEDFQE